jgi:hypothetical protein
VQRVFPLPSLKVTLPVAKIGNWPESVTAEPNVGAEADVTAVGVAVVRFWEFKVEPAISAPVTGLAFVLVMELIPLVLPSDQVDFWKFKAEANVTEEPL